MERDRRVNSRMRNFQIDDLSKFSGIVPEGLLNRMATVGGIPKSGPGKYTIPRILTQESKSAKKQEPPQTKTQRRHDNMTRRVNPW